LLEELVFDLEQDLQFGPVSLAGAGSMLLIVLSCALDWIGPRFVLLRGWLTPA